MPIVDALDAALHRLYRLSGLVAAVLLVLLTALVLLSILSRMVGVFIGGLTEYAGYTMAASAFFAMSYSFRSGGHIRVNVVISRFGPRGRRIADLWCLAVMAVVTAYLAWYLGQMAYVSWQFGEISEGGDALPLWIPQVPTAIGAVIFAVASLHTFIRAFADPSAIPDGAKTGDAL